MNVFEPKIECIGDYSPLTLARDTHFGIILLVAGVDSTLNRYKTTRLLYISWGWNVIAIMPK